MSSPTAIEARAGQDRRRWLAMPVIAVGVTMTLPPQGWVGRVAAVAIAGLTAIVALTSSDVPLGRVRFAAGAALAAVIATVLARVASSDGLLGVAFVVDSLLLAIAAVTILRRVVSSAMVDFRTILEAISVFTLLGLLFGFLFLALGRLVAGDVFVGVSLAGSGVSVLQLYDADDDRVRQAGTGRGTSARSCPCSRC